MNIELVKNVYSTVKPVENAEELLKKIFECVSCRRVLNIVKEEWWSDGKDNTLCENCYNNFDITKNLKTESDKRVQVRNYQDLVSLSLPYRCFKCYKILKYVEEMYFLLNIEICRTCLPENSQDFLKLYGVKKTNNLQSVYTCLRDCNGNIPINITPPDYSKMNIHKDIIIKEKLLNEYKKMINNIEEVNFSHSLLDLVLIYLDNGRENTYGILYNCFDGYIYRLYFNSHSHLSILRKMSYPKFQEEKIKFMKISDKVYQDITGHWSGEYSDDETDSDSSLNKKMTISQYIGSGC